VAIKLGQFLSTRADVFGEQFATDLGRLKDRLPPFLERRGASRGGGRPEPAVRRGVRQLRAAGGRRLAGAGPPATLKDGRRVAVKVLRPGIERRVAREVAAMRRAARLADRWVPPARRLEPAAFVHTVARALALELDLRMEAAGADELRAVMARDGFMRAPEVVWEVVSRRVLALTWADGQALSDPGALEQPGLDRAALADNLTRGFLAQALDHGVFHADLHEGNLFVCAPAVITAVDFGIVGRLGPGERRYLAEILWGFLRRDYRAGREVHFEAGYVPQHARGGDFAQALRRVGEPIFGRPAHEVSMGRLMAQLFEVTALFDMRLRPELVLLQKTMVTVEGVARRIDPGHDIWAAARPVVERWVARELGAGWRGCATSRVKGGGRSRAWRAWPRRRLSRRPSSWSGGCCRGCRCCSGGALGTALAALLAD
jgi:ubiquinone biosynthesis protein